MSLYALSETTFPEEVTTFVSNRRAARDGLARRKIQMQAEVATAFEGRGEGAGEEKDEVARET